MEKASVLQLDKMTLGVCYYPEHWKEELWEQDLARMLQSGLRVIRIEIGRASCRERVSINV